jgi:hypothetical protein
VALLTDVRSRVATLVSDRAARRVDPEVAGAIIGMATLTASAFAAGMRNRGADVRWKNARAPGLPASVREPRVQDAAGRRCGRRGASPGWRGSP